MTDTQLIDGLSRINSIKKKMREDADIAPEEFVFWKSWHATLPNKLMQIDPQNEGCFGLGE
jgi:hypothetical protein